ncbi:SDR family oxidoreductase [Rhizobium oryzihabitans]|uniref:SDR family oxidoreductase n=1 Tax=Rhizobium oryzihabitans TaxID=2267833 RepID=A0A7L5BLY3_9HYPH|nr:SDR family NAD(P)-dependent oxidoreductase [Rhizobium oryzihabitans]QCM06903.1 SDR family oxidoreductase [Agrobacterium tumefaciens]QIB39904.1 SDR family oxidoreductase [Rhizobium oryzihabitans]
MTLANGKVALVTGAGSGIGRAAALHLAAEGFSVGLLGRTESELQAVENEISAATGASKVLVADVADEMAMRHAVATLVQDFGRLDVVVANAGVNGVWAPIDDLKPSEWDDTIRINLRGTYLTIHASVPHLKAAGGGSIVIVSSINGTRTFTSPGATAYSVTKAGQLAMAQQLALELGRHRIRVNAVCPGEIETAIDENTDIRGRDKTEVPVRFPEGDIPVTGGVAGTSEDVAALIGFLASDRSRHITGTPIWIDGGQGLLR